MALAPPRDRLVTARMRAQRRAIRARLAAAVAVAVVAWWSHAASALPQQDVARSATGAATGERIDVGQEARPLGPSASGAGGAGQAGTGAASGWGDVVRTGAALVVVVGLIGGAWWWLRRTGIGGAMRGGAFEVLARQPMGRGQQVVVVRFGPRVLCLQQTREGMRTLCELSDADEIAALTAQLQRGGAPMRTRPVEASDAAERTVDIRRGRQS